MHELASSQRAAMDVKHAWPRLHVLCACARCGCCRSRVFVVSRVSVRFAVGNASLNLMGGWVVGRKGGKAERRMRAHSHLCFVRST